MGCGENVSKPRSETLPRSVFLFFSLSLSSRERGFKGNHIPNQVLPFIAIQFYYYQAFTFEEGTRFLNLVLFIYLVKTMFLLNIKWKPRSRAQAHNRNLYLPRPVRLNNLVLPLEQGNAVFIPRELGLGETFSPPPLICKFKNSGLSVFECLSWALNLFPRLNNISSRFPKFLFRDISLLCMRTNNFI